METDSGLEHSNNFKYYIEDYWDIVVGILAIVTAIFMHKSGHGAMATTLAAIGIAALSVTVSEVAEILSERLMEPYGSMVLTFSAVVVEIILLYIILLEAVHSPEVIETVKGGIISAVIVDMNVLLGTCGIYRWPEIYRARTQQRDFKYVHYYIVCDGVSAFSSQSFE